MFGRAPASPNPLRALAAAALGLVCLAGPARAAGEATVSEAVAMLVETPGQAVRAASYLSCAVMEQCNCALPVSGRYVGYIEVDALSCYPQSEGGSADLSQFDLTVDGADLRLDIAVPLVLPHRTETTDQCVYDEGPGALGMAINEVFLRVGPIFAPCGFNFGFDMLLNFSQDRTSFDGAIEGFGAYSNPSDLRCVTIPSPCYASMTIYGLRFP